MIYRMFTLLGLGLLGMFCQVASALEYREFALQKGESLSVVAKARTGLANNWVSLRAVNARTGHVYNESEYNRLPIGTKVLVPVNLLKKSFRPTAPARSLTDESTAAVAKIAKPAPAPALGKSIDAWLVRRLDGVSTETLMHLMGIGIWVSCTLAAFHVVFGRYELRCWKLINSSAFAPHFIVKVVPDIVGGTPGSARPYEFVPHSAVTHNDFKMTVDPSLRE